MREVGGMLLGRRLPDSRLVADRSPLTSVSHRLLRSKALRRNNYALLCQRLWSICIAAKVLDTIFIISNTCCLELN